MVPEIRKVYRIPDTTHVYIYTVVTKISSLRRISSVVDPELLF
jgi:hypothetical protein